MNHRTDDAPLHAKVLTVSDGVFHGATTTPAAVDSRSHLTANGFDVVDHQVTQDGAGEADRLIEMSDGFAGLIVTTGGTVFAPGPDTGRRL